ncbi:hypothetical protein [Kordiimonas aestuarii]|uniref:hypothetical protein n=1 Tax=Kordiimonas aestuarii TaxID=1005925 RepID=UPI0021CE115A|nr:hypothetical protein [Kordiimonas aestuarii]
MDEDNDKPAFPKGPRYVPPAERGKAESAGETMFALFIGIGVALGTTFGIALDNIGLGIALGVSIGAGLGIAMSKTAGAREKDGEQG